MVKLLKIELLFTFPLLTSLIHGEELLSRFESRRIAVHKGIDPKRCVEAHRFQVGDHFGGVFEFCRVKGEIAKMGLPAVVDFDLGRLEVVLFDVGCKVQDLLLRHVAVVLRPSAPDGVGEEGGVGGVEGLPDPVDVVLDHVVVGDLEVGAVEDVKAEGVFLLFEVRFQTVRWAGVDGDAQCGNASIRAEFRVSPQEPGPVLVENHNEAVRVEEEVLTDGAEVFGSAVVLSGKTNALGDGRSGVHGPALGPLLVRLEPVGAVVAVVEADLPIEARSRPGPAEAVLGAGAHEGAVPLELHHTVVREGERPETVGVGDLEGSFWGELVLKVLGVFFSNWFAYLGHVDAVDGEAKDAISSMSVCQVDYIVHHFYLLAEEGRLGLVCSGESG